MPSLSADDPNYSPEGRFWRGGVWAPAVYMVVRGLAAAGYGDLAHEVALRYLEGLRRVFDAIEPHTLWECCAPDVDRPGLKPYSGETVKPDFVGWSGLGPIAMLMENVIGIESNAAEGTVDWTIRRADEHGITGLGVGDGASADFRCARRGAAAEEAVVTVRTGRDLVLRLRRGRAFREARCAAGSENRLVL